MLAVLKAGDEVLVSDAVYKPTRRFCDQVLGRFGVDDALLPAGDASPEAVMAMADARHAADRAGVAPAR